MSKTKIHFKNIAQKSLFVIFGLLLAVGASYVSATSRPSNVNSNSPTVLNTGTNDQTKSGSLKTLAFIAGDYASKDKTGINFALIDNLGVMSLGRNDTPASSLKLGLDIGATTGIKGTIRVKDLASSGTKEVCVDANGKLIFCNNEKEFVSTNYASDYYGLMVPEGVTSMTVEVYGAGGAGYAKDNINTSIDDGQSSYVIGDGVTIIAEGGKGADSSTAGGKGGTASVTGGNITTQTTTDGGDGTAPGTFSSSPTQTGPASNCNGTNYVVVQGANGNTGGKGGKAYNGSNANGGNPGTASYTYGTYKGIDWNFNTSSGAVKDAADCDYKDQTSDNYIASQYINNRPGGDGNNGATYGSGGAGFGGKGGLSAVDISTANCDKCDGGNGSSGGGAGAYAKATFSTNVGATYYLKVGYRGLPKTPSCTGSMNNNTCLNDLGGGAKSGSGADGYIKITYN
jgi:hypothetical protein